MRKKKSALLLAFITLILYSICTASAQEPEGFLKGFSVHGRIGYMDITQANDSFKAVFNSSGGISLGAGMKIDFPEGIFFETSLDYWKKSGKRVFVSGSQVFQTDLSTSVTIMPLSFSGGFQFLRDKSISPYVGGGLCFAYFKEEEITPWEDSTPLWNAGYHILGGAEFLKRETVSLAAEAKWSSIAKVIGNHGVSAYYEEDNIGGLSIIFKINFHLK